MNRSVAAVADSPIVNWLSFKKPRLRSLFKARQSSIKSDRENGQLDRLAQLNREIDYLEAKLKEVQSKTNRSLA